jgi:uncharacterized protein with NAD-binding domain and iron-sulfur cluster
MASPDPTPTRVAILGGGMAGLAAAWRLSDPTASRRCHVTVYQRGGILGGKAASVRGRNDRIEEHGLHVWLGYYDNAFRIVREVYDELDRPTTRPLCPFGRWQDAFAPAPMIGIEDLGEPPVSWLADFSGNELLPGEPVDRVRPILFADVARRSLQLLGDFYGSLTWGPGAAGTALAATAIAGAAGLASRLLDEVTRLPVGRGLTSDIGAAVDAIATALRTVALADEPTRRLFHLFDIVVTQLRGIIADGLLTDPTRIHALNHLEYREWLTRHGAHETTLQSPLVRAMYGLAFSHRDGDRSREEFPADLGLTLATRMFFDYKGSLFWKMQAGMGDVVIAPIYEALRSRGVSFEFFHRVDALRHDGHGRLDRVELARQVHLAPRVAEYDPLVEIGKVPCFRPDIDLAQVDSGAEIHNHELTSAWNEWPDASHITIEIGRDYDEVVLAIPVGMIRDIASDLIDHEPRWRQMVEHVSTVGTKAMQLWLRAPEDDLGWSYTGSTVTAHPGAFDTFASMSHLLQHESWPDDVRTVAYFCCTAGADESLQAARQRTLDDAIDYIDHDLRHYYPGAYDIDGQFRWELLAGNDRGATGAAALATQYVRVNLDPSDRYVQALPGTDRYRMRPDDSGFAHLWLAGDWTDCGLNAGCIEAAVVSGLQAANGVLGRHRLADITGIMA